MTGVLSRCSAAKKENARLKVRLLQLEERIETSRLKELKLLDEILQLREQVRNLHGQPKG